MQSPNWIAFNEESARLGTLVGFKNALDPYDLSNTGVLQVDNKVTMFRTVIRGKTLYVNNLGVVIKTVPDTSQWNNMSVMMVTFDMEMSYGTHQAITRSVGEEYEKVAELNALEPRDEFAINALTAMMSRLEGCESFDDARILSVCQQAYKWAQGMMIASANARSAVKKAVEEPEPDQEPEEDNNIDNSPESTSP